MKIGYPKYLLGANSCEGFVSYFGESFNRTDGWRALIIKGGPGTGKSTFMKKIAEKAVNSGLEAELCVCSSDPQSLDGVIIKDKKTVILDGTAPHVVEPIYPGACEEIVNLGEFWRGEDMRKNASEIISSTNKNQKLHKTASGYIQAAGELICDNLKLSSSYTDLNSAEQFGKRIAQKLFVKKKNFKPYEWVRFIGGISPQGIEAYADTVENFYKNIIIIDDKYGAAANAVMNSVRKTVLERGYEIITLKNPFLPSKLIDHILVPELSLAFVTENEYIKFSSSQRRIHARRFADVELMHRLRGRMLFNRRVARELLAGASKTLALAKAEHDTLESYYINAMDFDAVSQYAEQMSNEILK